VQKLWEGVGGMCGLIQRLVIAAPGESFRLMMCCTVSKLSASNATELKISKIVKHFHPF